jgi:hypothetical protein
MIIKKSVVYSRPTGIQQAIIVDFSDPFQYVNDKGESKTTCVAVYQTKVGYKNEAGIEIRHLISEYITPSLHPKSKLRARLEGLVGRKLPDHEVPDGFDTSKLIGKNVMLNLIQDESGYSRVQSISKLADGLDPITAVAYVRPAWITEQINKRLVDPSASVVESSKDKAPDKIDLNDVLSKI